MNYPNKVIKEGEADKAIVKAVQIQLNAKGCGPISADGDFGKKTVAAIKTFQSRNTDDHGNPLEIDGKIGAITWHLLFDEKPTLIIVASNPLLNKVLEIAKTQLNVREDKKHTNRGPEVEMYQKRVGVTSGSAWCAAFVYWCFDEAAKEVGLVNPLVKTAGCLAHWNKATCFKIKRITAIGDTASIKPGFIFIMDHGKGAGHTGIVTKVEGGFVYTIEGNTNLNRGRDGYGVFELKRTISSIQKGFLAYI